MHEAVHDRFVEAFAAQTAALRIGHGLGKHEIGPLVSEAARAKVQHLVSAALSAGARLVCGGTAPDRKGWFYEPTILTHVTPEMAIMNEEIFGPLRPSAR